MLMQQKVSKKKYNVENCVNYKPNTYNKRILMLKFNFKKQINNQKELYKEKKKQIDKETMQMSCKKTNNKVRKSSINYCNNFGINKLN
jgi:hypothetical protein